MPMLLKFSIQPAQPKASPPHVRSAHVSIAFEVELSTELDEKCDFVEASDGRGGRARELRKPRGEVVWLIARE